MLIDCQYLRFGSFHHLSGRLSRYRESPTSFSALALQTSGLSQSPSALYDRDHPHMGGVAHEGIVFKQMNKSELDRLRSSIGLEDWTSKRGSVCDIIEFSRSSTDSPLFCLPPNSRCNS